MTSSPAADPVLLLQQYCRLDVVELLLVIAVVSERELPSVFAAVTSATMPLEPAVLLNRALS